ncbi:hypothetical protein SAMN06297422_11963 [Lachnospiraceae bacterium]|nr:hypothetical protein SAMN06297422_11963 [Lachnospiraceae bacterium]
MKKISKIMVLALASLIILFMMPVQSYARLAGPGVNSSLPVSGKGGNLIEYVSYEDPEDGTVAVYVSLNFYNGNKMQNFKFYAFDLNGNVLAEEDGTKGTDVISSGGNISYTYKKTFPSADKIKIWGGNAGVTPANAFSEAAEIQLAYSETDPVKSKIKVEMKSGAVNYKKMNAAYGYTIYELNATEDALVTISDYKVTNKDGGSSDNNASLAIVDELQEGKAPNMNDYLHTWSTNAILNSWDSANGLKFPLNKGTHYLVSKSSAGTEFSFNMEFRKYIHCNVVWTAKEGDINEAFKQQKTIHITAKITNPESDGRFPKNMTYTAPGTSGETMQVSDDGLTASFEFKTRNQAGVDTITINAKELNPVKHEYNPTSVDEGRPYSVDIMTGIEISDIGLTTGYNYINIDTQRLPDFGSGKPAQVTIYLKNGSKWVKKISTTPGGKGGTIKKLKANKKYEVKLVMTKELTNGKTVKTESVFKVKTGPKQKPVIKSAKISNVRKTKRWIDGYWSGNVWHRGHYVTITSYTVTITLKSKLKGCKGISCMGVKVKGKGKVFKFTTTGNPPSKLSVYGYSNDKYMGYTPCSKSKKTSR